MPTLSQNLILPRCPHCSVDSPNLFAVHRCETREHSGENLRRWVFYSCGRCGGVVIAAADNFDQEAKEVYPQAPQVDHDLPEKAKAYLEQAYMSINAPAGAVMLAASAVDAMLKEKTYLEGSLYKRIEKAAADHLITEDMAKWAHEVRLDANDQRHSDQTVSLPTQVDAKRAIDFAAALGTFLFVLPTRVRRGLTEAADKQP